MKKLRTTSVLVVIAAAVFVAVRYGGSGHTGMGSMNDNVGSTRPSVAAAVTRTIEIDMADFSFSPNQLQATDGSTVRFVFHNHGTLTHEAFIGDAMAQDAHEKEMANMNGMATMHDTDAVTVPLGGTGQLTYTFRHLGAVLIACHMPGHYAAGMKLTIGVDP